MDARCPACGRPGLALRTVRHEVPYFGDCMETLVSCPSCAFRHADFLILNQKEAVRHAFRIESVDDLVVRVVRANSCTIRVPELGFLAEPTPRSEAFVSNVQGVLGRVRDVLLTARVIYADDPESVRVAEERLAQLARVEAGEEPATVVFDDPFGNSAILSDRSVVRPLSADEVASLQTGYVILDEKDLVDRADPASGAA